jgi:exodeoxyribonuclease-5
MGIELNKGQIYATYDLEMWWRHKKSKQVIEIDGPAGSGKTTIIMYFIQKLGLDLNDVLFVSYMGKAVSQMIRNNLPAKTIHSSCYDCEKVVDRDEDGNIIFLPSGKVKTKLQFTLKEKIPSKPKLIVIDEGYMVPEKNAVDLLSFGIPVIVLGDTNQLPPVFGNPYFLNDPDIHLTQIMRQAEGDPIIYLSQMGMEI